MALILAGDSAERGVEVDQAQDAERQREDDRVGGIGLRRVVEMQPVLARRRAREPREPRPLHDRTAELLLEPADDAVVAVDQMEALVAHAERLELGLLVEPHEPEEIERALLRRSRARTPPRRSR